MKNRLPSGRDGWLKPQGPAPRERLPFLSFTMKQASV